MEEFNLIGDFDMGKASHGKLYDPRDIHRKCPICGTLYNHTILKCTTCNTATKLVALVKKDK